VRARLGSLLTLAFRGNHRELAVEFLRLALDLRAEGGKARPHETFFVSVVAYMLDDPQAGTVDVTRSAFRAATRELLATAPRKGVPRGGALAASLWPRLALRGSFNEHYRSEGERDGYRQIAAIEWPNVMLGFEEHVGLELSVLDLAAPLAEIAVRPPGTWDRQQLLLLDAVRPRLGLYLAVPELTSRLAASIGAGVRLVAPAPDPAMQSYQRRMSLVVDLGVEWVF
jgi:hypothetical protein